MNELKMTLDSGYGYVVTVQGQQGHRGFRVEVERNGDVTYKYEFTASLNAAALVLVNISRREFMAETMPRQTENSTAFINGLGEVTYIDYERT